MLFAYTCDWQRMQDIKVYLGKTRRKSTQMRSLKKQLKKEISENYTSGDFSQLFGAGRQVEWSKVEVYSGY